MNFSDSNVIDGIENLRNVLDRFTETHPTLVAAALSIDPPDNVFV
jgi:hypothetical protein